MTNDILKAHVYANGDEAQAEVALWGDDVAEVRDHEGGYVVELSLRGATYYVG